MYIYLLGLLQVEVKPRGMQAYISNLFLLHAHVGNAARLSTTKYRNTPTCRDELLALTLGSGRVARAI